MTSEPSSETDDSYDDESSLDDDDISEDHWENFFSKLKVTPTPPSTVSNGEDEQQVPSGDHSPTEDNESTPILVVGGQKGSVSSPSVTMGCLGKEKQEPVSSVSKQISKKSNVPKNEGKIGKGDKKSLFNKKRDSRRFSTGDKRSSTSEEGKRESTSDSEMSKVKKKTKICPKSAILDAPEQIAPQSKELGRETLSSPFLRYPVERKKSILQRFKIKKERSSKQDQKRGATRIQAIWRGYYLRKRLSASG